MVKVTLGSTGITVNKNGFGALPNPFILTVIPVLPSVTISFIIFLLHTIFIKNRISSIYNSSIIAITFFKACNYSE